MGAVYCSSVTSRTVTLPTVDQALACCPGLWDAVVSLTNYILKFELEQFSFLFSSLKIQSSIYCQECLKS